MKTIIVLTIETDKKPPNQLLKVIEARAYDYLVAKGIKVGKCQGGSHSQDGEK
jgi:hypothetical protein